MITVGLMFAAYVWACQQFYILNVIDTCLDGGVGYDSVSRACTGLPFGEIWDTGARATYWFWLILLAAPALLLVVLNQIFHYVWSRIIKRRSTSRLQPTSQTTDADGR